MRHKGKLKKLSKPTDQRLALLRSGAGAVIKYGKIKTTITRAKEIRKVVEHLVTFAKANSVSSRREAYKILPDRDLIKILFDVAPKFNERHGGYTRITRIGIRKGDAACLALLEFVE